MSASRPSDLGLVGHELGQRAGQADGLIAQALAHEVGAGGGRVALVEQQVQHAEHRRGALGQQVVGRDPVGDAGVADLALGPHQALRHGRLGDEEGAGDLCRGQAGEGAQRERDPRLERQRRVAAGEDQPQPVVRHSAVVRLGRLVGGRQHRHLLQLGGPGRGAAQHGPRRGCVRWW